MAECSSGCGRPAPAGGKCAECAAGAVDRIYRDESRQAYRRALRSASRRAREVIRYVVERGHEGATVDEARRHFGWRTNQIALVFTHLVADGVLVRTDDRRPTELGAMAPVHRLHPRLRGESTAAVAAEQPALL